ncbi:hypothetical protein ACFWP4_30680, partial [Streptomyces sp. NPDC058486]
PLPERGAHRPPDGLRRLGRPGPGRGTGRQQIGRRRELPYRLPFHGRRPGVPGPPQPPPGAEHTAHARQKRRHRTEEHPRAAHASDDRGPHRNRHLPHPVRQPRPDPPHPSPSGRPPKSPSTQQAAEPPPGTQLPPPPPHQAERDPAKQSAAQEE